MRSIVSFLHKLFGTPAPTNTPQVVDVYPELRNRILTMKPQKLGLTSANYPHTVWGVVMESGSSAGTVTVVALYDGTASFYVSSGGGIIGTNQHAASNKAAVILVQIANNYTSACMPINLFPYPRQGEARFYLLTFTGATSAAASEAELGNNHHALSPLFHAAQGLITQIRLVEQEKSHR